jgi:hypothetical protein
MASLNLKLCQQSGVEGKPSQKPLSYIKVPAVTKHYSSRFNNENTEAYVTLNITSVAPSWLK